MAPIRADLHHQRNGAVDRRFPLPVFNFVTRSWCQGFSFEGWLIGIQFTRTILELGAVVVESDCKDSPARWLIDVYCFQINRERFLLLADYH